MASGGTMLATAWRAVLPSVRYLGCGEAARPDGCCPLATPRPSSGGPSIQAPAGFEGAPCDDGVDQDNRPPHDAAQDYPEFRPKAARLRLRAGATSEGTPRSVARSRSATPQGLAPGLLWVLSKAPGLRSPRRAALRVCAAVGNRGLSPVRTASLRLLELRHQGRADAMGHRQVAAHRVLR